VTQSEVVVPAEVIWHWHAAAISAVALEDLCRIYSLLCMHKVLHRWRLDIFVFEVLLTSDIRRRDMTVEPLAKNMIDHRDGMQQGHGLSKVVCRTRMMVCHFLLQVSGS
jgi:hypothetical protein